MSGGPVGRFAPSPSGRMHLGNLFSSLLAWLSAKSDGRRLSKRDGDLSLDALLSRMTAEELVGRLALLAGLNPGGGPRTPESLLPDFDWEKVPRRDITVPEHLFSGPGA